MNLLDKFFKGIDISHKNNKRLLKTFNETMSLQAQVLSLDEVLSILGISSN